MLKRDPDVCIILRGPQYVYKRLILNKLENSISLYVKNDIIIEFVILFMLE